MRFVEIVMSFMKFNGFGELYRAAFAETDEQEKSRLLQQVQRIIDSHQPESCDESDFEPRAA